MYHSIAYVARLIAESHVPETQRGYMLRALSLLAKECHAMYASMENDVLSDYWEPRNVIARILAQTIPADSALRARIAELLHMYEDELATCVFADRASGCIEPLDPVTTTKRSRLPQVESFLIVKPVVLHELHERNRFVNLVQDLLLQEFPHLAIAIVALEQRRHPEQAVQLLIHYSETDPEEDNRIENFVTHTCAALLAALVQTARPD